MTRVFRTAALASVLGLISACNSLDSNVPQAVPIEQTTFAASLGVNIAASTRTANGAYYRDIVVGTGPVIVNGQTITARYTGWLSSGLQFDSNTTTGFPFALGTGRVIAGWDEGLQGARVGTTRQLVIPANLAYGPSGFGPIPGNAVIVFNIEIVSAQ